MTKTYSDGRTVIHHNSARGEPATIIHRGRNGEIVLEQSGPCNDALVEQTGVANSATVRQTGSGNRVVVSQGDGSERRP